jgi:hypothetical protein
LQVIAGSKKNVNLNSMKKRALFFLFIGLTFLSIGQQTDSLKLSELEGRWFVVRSNFPMWLKGKKTNPSFSYTVTSKGKNTVLLDEVQYQKKSKAKSIVGYDKPVNTQNRSFVWRGKGILAGLKSKWSILYLDSNQQWMIIHFKKTLFTPEGYDVISKSKSVNPETDRKVLEKLKELKIDQLTIIHQD